MDRLELAEARQQLINASDLKQYDTVIRVGSTHASLLTCGDVDVLWRIGEAFAKTDRDARAKDAYGYVLDNCTKPEDRLATVQKALPLLTAPRPRCAACQRKSRSGWLQGIRFHSQLIWRARLSPMPAQIRKLAVSPADVSRVEKLATDVVEPSDPLILGWYYLRRNDVQAAEKWFKLARDRENSASSSQGLALAMIAQVASRGSRSDSL